MLSTVLSIAVQVPKPRITVICEPAVLDDPLIKEEEFKSIADQLLTWDDGMYAIHDII